MTTTLQDFRFATQLRLYADTNVGKIEHRNHHEVRSCSHWQTMSQNDMHQVDADTQLDILPMVTGHHQHNDGNEGRENGQKDDYSHLYMKAHLPKTIQYVPPLNFSLVEDGIYRSGFPMPINYPFLERLEFKTIIYLGDLGQEKKEKKDKEKKDTKEKDKDKEKEKEKDKNTTLEVLANYKQWIDSTDIKFHHLMMESSQEPFLNKDRIKQAQESLTTALQLMLDRNNFPMLIHSNKGKHRIGVLVGLMRKILQGWCMSGIFEEYEKFAMGKSEIDLEFIELWQPELWVDDKWRPDFVRC